MKSVKVNGNWRWCRLAVDAKGRLRPDFVVVNGSEQRHTKGRFGVFWKEKGQTRFAVRQLPVCPGEALYYRYGCNSCRGDNGLGIGDLRRATQDFPADAQLEAFIRHAPSFKPGSEMPAWNGIISEGDYAPLIAYVWELGRAAQ